LTIALCLVPDAGRSTVDDAAKRVSLQKDCAAMDDCFEHTGDLAEWIWGTRDPAPNADDPLIVDIGPGKFEPLHCPSSSSVNGYVTFRGAGRDHSIIAASLENPLLGAVLVEGCDHLGFQDLRFQFYFIAAYWKGAGSSTWTNVDLVAPYAGWYDDACGGSSAAAPAGIHYFFGSRIETEQLGFYGECGESWFYGGEVTVNARGTLGSMLRTGIRVVHRGDVRLFGAALRIVTDGLPAGQPPVTAIGVNVGESGNNGTPHGSGAFHMHGGIISLSQKGATNGDVIGVKVDRFGVSGGDAMAHIVDTAWTLEAGAGGDATRVVEANGGHVHSPFLWPAGDAPPTAIHTSPSSPLVQSLTGYDMYVETDCAANADCDPPGNGNQTHLMIYNDDACPASMPWFDSTAGVCRVP
jgi:hypothetical protein